MTPIEQSLFDAMKRIRELGYNSQAHRATDAVLACTRIAEESILAVEIHNKEQAKAGVCPTCLSDLCVCVGIKSKRKQAAISDDTVQHLERIASSADTKRERDKAKSKLAKIKATYKRTSEGQWVKS